MYWVPCQWSLPLIWRTLVEGHGRDLLRLRLSAEVGVLGLDLLHIDFLRRLTFARVGLAGLLGSRSGGRGLGLRFCLGIRCLGRMSSICRFTGGWVPLVIVFLLGFHRVV